jgi:hypothetical protein
VCKRASRPALSSNRVGRMPAPSPQAPPPPPTAGGQRYPVHDTSVDTLTTGSGCPTGSRASAKDHAEFVGEAKWLHLRQQAFWTVLPLEGSRTRSPHLRLSPLGVGSTSATDDPDSSWIYTYSGVNPENKSKSAPPEANANSAEALRSASSKLSSPLYRPAFGPVADFRKN